MAGAAVDVTDANFKAVVGSGVALVDFWATWCPPCRAQTPIIEKVASKFEGKATVAKLDVDANQGTAAHFGVQSIPTLILLKDGKEAQRFVGLQTEDKLTSALTAALAG